ncbi:unnamed protein product [Effrenium voratum]|nr:unnamed protein product [Effrenium voratum]
MARDMDITLLADGTWKMLVIDGLWLKLRRARASRPAATKQQRYALKRSDGSDMELVRHGGATLAVASLALLAFHPTFHGTWEFLWDDLENFGPEAQPFLRVTWANLAAWGGPETAAFSLRVYEPLALALKSCAAEAAELSCRNLHILAGACHALAAALAFLGTKAIARGDEDLTWRSALGAGLFAVHPLCAQVVCWASCLPYIWSTIFSWLAVLLFLHSLRSGAAAVAGRSAALSAACYAAAALCKAAALPLPAMLTLLRLSYGQPAKRPPELLHWLGFCVLLRWALLAAQDGEEVQSVAVQLTPQDNLLRAAGSVFAHLMLLWPGEAVPFQPLALAGLTPAQRWLGAFAAALLAMSASYALWRLREARWCSLWLSFLALLSPCLQLVQHGDPVWFADRYGYLPMCLVLPSVVVLLPKSRARWALAGPLLALLAYQSQGRCQLWRNGTDLWAAAAASNPQWPEFHHQLGVCLAASSRHAEAEAALRNAWALRQDAITAKALGHLEGLKKPKEGLRWLAEALALGLSKKQAASALHDMAALESRKKRPKLQRVLELYNQSLQLAPRRGLTQESFGLALAVAERFPEAVQALQAARSLGRNGADLHHGLGHALLAQGRAAEAQSAFEEALRLRPKWTEARRKRERQHLSDMEGLELGRCVLRHLLEPVKEPLIEMIMKALKVVDQLVIWALEQLGYLIGQVVKVLVPILEKATKMMPTWLLSVIAAKQCDEIIGGEIMQAKAGVATPLKTASDPGEYVTGLFKEAMVNATAEVIAHFVMEVFREAFPTHILPLLHQAEEGFQKLEGIVTHWLDGICGLIPEAGGIVCGLITTMVSNGIQYMSNALMNFGVELSTTFLTMIANSSPFFRMLVAQVLDSAQTAVQDNMNTGSSESLENPPEQDTGAVEHGPTGEEHAVAQLSNAERYGSKLLQGFMRDYAWARIVFAAAEPVLVKELAPVMHLLQIIVGQLATAMETELASCKEKVVAFAGLLKKMG